MPPLTWVRWLASVATYCQLGRKANACGEGSAGCHPDGGSETPLSEAGTEAWMSWMSINRTTEILSCARRDQPAERGAETAHPLTDWRRRGTGDVKARGTVWGCLQCWPSRCRGA